MKSSLKKINQYSGATQVQALDPLHISFLCRKADNSCPKLKGLPYKNTCPLEMTGKQPNSLTTGCSLIRNFIS